MDAIKQLTLWLAAGTETIAAVLIGLAVLEGAVRAFLVFLIRSPPADPEPSHEAKEEVRLRLGRWLGVALEFELGADILRTAVAPTWSEIGQLAAIAAVRTALNFFLQQEIDKATLRRTGLPPTAVALRSDGQDGAPHQNGQPTRPQGL